MTVSSTLGVITSITSPVIYGSAAQWGTISIDSTSHASKGRLTLGGDGVQVTSNDIYDKDGTLRIRFTSFSPGVAFFGNWQVTGDYVGTFGFNPLNAYDVAVQMQLGGGGVSMDIRAGDRTAGDGRYRVGFGLAGTISSAIWELAAGTLTIAGPSGSSPGAAVLIGAVAAPEAGYALELRDDFLAGAFFTEMREMSAPGVPATNGVRIYAVDVGGKTQLTALFASGAAQQIAIEP